jgi:hypothetical protein
MTPEKKEFHLILNRRLYLLLKTFLTINSTNWTKYDNFVVPVLVDKKHLGVDKKIKEFEELNAGELKELKSRMEYIREILEEQKIPEMTLEGILK